MRKHGRLAASFAVVTVAGAIAGCASQTSSYFIPQSISPQARAIYEKLIPLVVMRRAVQTTPRTLAEFDARRAEAIASAEPKNAALLKKLNVTSADMRLGGISVVETRPPRYRDDGTVLIRVHGGGFVLDSARSSVGGDALMAIATGKRIVSVDYTVAPRGKWPLVTDEVISVYKALLAEGRRASSIGMFGDSAGGNIVAASVLKLRDQGLEMPGAIVLLSPATDLTQSGDTNTTLRYADPALGTEDLSVAAEQYADRTDWKNPYVSPVYGDFKKGYPPVLIQVGTKELLLSDSVRLYQAIKVAGGDAVLDVYEGMSHVFQSYMMDTPEQKAAYAEVQGFLSRYLVPTKRADTATQ
ncbi:MAG: alpha/beta hydrolase [Nevskiales bacterium]